MPRYVILEHDYPILHWDLMLESGSILRTWRLAVLPSAGTLVVAEAIHDHRLHYLDYEGPISGNRGQVVRWDSGTFATRDWNAERIALTLVGERLKGELVLERVAGEEWKAAFIP